MSPVSAPGHTILLISENNNPVVDNNQAETWSLHQNRETIGRSYERILVDVVQGTGPKQEQGDADVIEIVCNVVHKLGIGRDVHCKCHGGRLDVGCLRILSRVRSTFHYSQLQGQCCAVYRRRFRQYGLTGTISYKKWRAGERAGRNKVREWVAGGWARRVQDSS